MIYLLNWRLWVLVALLIAFPATYVKGRHDQKRLDLADTAAAVAEANREAHKNEQLRQRNVDDAASAAAARARSILDSAVHARAERDGLRESLDAVQRAAASSLTASNNALHVTSELLGSCTAEYLSVAEQADRADSEARELRQAWPR